MKAIKSICLFLLFPLLSVAQNSMTSSPYSMFGIGEFASGLLYGQNAAMMGTAYGVRNPSLINIENPAGMTGMESHKLLIETSAFTKHESYQSRGSSNSTFTGNLSAFILGGRIMPRWYMAASITPYTSAGYYFKSIQPLEGSPSTVITSTHEGSGGISKTSLSNALLLPYNISIGVNASFLFGTILQSETQETMSAKNKLSTQAFHADLGIQYVRKLNANTELTVGAVYGYQQKLTIDQQTTVTTSYSESVLSTSNVSQYIPQYAGAGGALNYRKMTYALDYTFRQYSVISSGDSRISFKDTHEVRSGVCYDPKGMTSDSFWKRSTYKAGIGVSTSYMSINGNNGLSLKASAGIGFPVSNGKISTALFFERTKIQGNKLENTNFGFILSYTIGERFYKVKL